MLVVTAIWRKTTDGWGLLAPVPFTAEKELHDRIEEEPQMLPVSGTPPLVVVGREVQLGPNYADLIAVEPAGRLAIIEIKLAANSEARRAILAQILTYAAFLDRMDIDILERRVLAKHLEKRGFASLSAAAASAVSDTYDAATFRDALAENVREGRFRLILVLDSAPPELVRLIGYLEARSEGLVIDLITVSGYEVGDETLLVPQRVAPERRPADVPDAQLGEVPPTAGANDFVQQLASLPDAARADGLRLVAWAQRLVDEGCATLSSVHGRDQDTLRINIPGDKNLVVAFRVGKQVRLAAWRNTFERCAPRSLLSLQNGSPPVLMTVGGWIPMDDRVLGLVAEAYREARGSEGLKLGALHPPAS